MLVYLKGEEANMGKNRCPVCNGMGQIIDIDAPVVGHLPCYMCKGTGRTQHGPYDCVVCDGSGKIAMQQRRYCSRCQGTGEIED